MTVIDAYRSRTAKQADWHLAPKPGTDGALAMALIHTVIDEDLVDTGYVADYTVGFDALAARSKSRTPEWAEAITGIVAADIRKLAREFATTEPAAIRIGVALEKQGGQFVLVSAADAGKRGIRDGDRVRVFNDRGAFEDVARLTDDVNAGVIVATVAYWRQLSRTAQLTSSVPRSS